MSCVLCLESTGATGDHINIGSNEAKVLNVLQILEKYFKEEINASSLGTATATATRIICRLCWQTVVTFHEFCLRVQRVHSELLLLKAESIKMEDDVNATIASSRKGRLVKKNRTVLASPPEHTVKPSETNMSSIDNNIHIEHMDLPSNRNSIEIDSLHLVGIKHEALQEEPMDADYNANAGDTENDDAEEASVKDHLDDSEASEYEVKKRKKRRKARTVHAACNESDDFIAQYFKLNCSLCGITLENFAELQTHIRAKHHTRGYARCCGKKFYRKGLLVDHLHIHRNPEHFKCAQCGKVLSSRSCYLSHLKTHDDGRGRDFQCGICAKKFFRRTNLERHAVMHVPEEQRVYNCKQCDKSYASNYTLLKHMKEVHLNTFSKMCDVCGKSIRGREALKLHMEEHAGIKHPPVQCQLCGIIVKSKYGLNHHMKTMHTEKYRTPQTCPICGKVSPSLRAHQSHMSYVHTRKPTHVCPTCGKSFKMLKNFKEHMTTHTGEVLYTCTYCPKTFNSNANMYSHRKKMHPKEWAENQLQKGIKPQ